jgi:hypothetical protein
MRALASAMLMIAAMFTGFATPFAGQVFADSVEAGTVEAGLDTSELCNPDNIYVPQPAAPSGRPCPAHVGETDETARARAYLIATATPGYTMTRQGPERAIERLHPEFVKRLAAAIAEARGQPTWVKIILADDPLRETVTADGPITLEGMFELGGSVIAASGS